MVTDRLPVSPNTEPHVVTLQEIYVCKAGHSWFLVIGLLLWCPTEEMELEVNFFFFNVPKISNIFFLSLLLLGSRPR